jgi:hypothetical protein
MRGNASRGPYVIMPSPSQKSQSTMKNLSKCALTTALCLGAAPVLAQSQGDLTLVLGVGAVLPKSNNPGAIEVNDTVHT